MKKKIVSVCITALMILNACASSPNNTDGSDDRITGNGPEMPFVVKSISSEEIQFENLLDDFHGIVECGGELIAVAEVDEQLSVFHIENDAISSKAALIQDKTQGKYVYRIGDREEDGFSILYGSAPEPQDANDYWLALYDVSGVLQNELLLPDLGYRFGPLSLSNGDTLLWVPDELLCVDNMGNQRTLEMPETIEMVSVEAGADGCLVVASQNESVGVMELNYEYEFGEFIPCVDNAAICYTQIDGKRNKKPVLNCGHGVYEYDYESHSFNELFGWNTIGVDGEIVEYLIQLDDNKWACSTYERDKIYIIEAEEHETMRKPIEIGVLNNTNPQISKYVAFFNSNNENYYAQIKYYTDEQQLITELTAGIVPDVLDVSISGIPLTNANFIDLIALISEDGSIETSEFTANILESMKMDNRLFVAVDSVALFTVIGRTEDVGDKPGWSMSQFKRVLDMQNTGSSAFPAWLTSDEMLLWVCYISMGQFVDEDNHTCTFNGDDFVSLLEFCADCPRHFDQTSLSSDYDENILLTVDMIENEYRLDAIKTNYGIKDYTFIGFPNDRGDNGSYLSCANNGMMFSIPTNAKNVEASWQFIRGMFSDKWQEQVDGIPMIQKAYDERFMNRDISGASNLDMADLEKFYDLLNRTEQFVYYDSAISDIIQEEAQTYFAGSKTSRQVADLIQSRVSLYLSERK